MPPEALSESKFSTQSDVWSFGILVWEILTFGKEKTYLIFSNMILTNFKLGKKPYGAMINSEVKEFVCNGGHLGVPTKCLPEISERLFLQCWAFAAKDRPSFETLKYELEWKFL